MIINCNGYVISKSKKNLNKLYSGFFVFLIPN